MTERGVYAIARGIWDDPDFADEPFTEREAFMWLVGEAAWKPHKGRGHHGPIALQRGELCMAVRFMAEAWGWSKSRVSRFLERLEKKGILRDTSRDNEKVYSIRNYNKFQVVSLPERDDIREESGTTAGQQRDKLEDRENKEIDYVEARASDISQAEEAALVEAAGKSLSASPNILVMAEPIRWKAAGISIELDAVPAIRAAASKRRPGSVHSWGYFTQAVADYHATRRAQMPPGVVRMQPGGRKTSTQGMMDAFRELRGEIAEPADDGGLVIGASYARTGH